MNISQGNHQKYTTLNKMEITNLIIHRLISKKIILPTCPEEMDLLRSNIRILLQPLKLKFPELNSAFIAINSNTMTPCILIQANGRNLDYINSNSIDAIVTDHPWDNKLAHKSNDQKDFNAQYDKTSFNYTLQDFCEKYRVLKKGCFIAESIPTESATNYEYLYSIKSNSKKPGLKYYAKIMWEKKPEGVVNTGRTTKGTEDILFLTKGKARKLSKKQKPYSTKNILKGRLNIPVPSQRTKVHQAEKPVELYKYLIENITNHNEIVLDQFSGSCNVGLACMEIKRYAILIEISHEIIENAVSRLGAIRIFDND